MPTIRNLTVLSLAFVAGYFVRNAWVDHSGGASVAAVALPRPGLPAIAGLAIAEQEARLGPGDPSAERVRVLIGPDDPVRGPADALVTVVAFSDYQCPYCRQADGLLAELADAYPDDVRVVVKHFPLPSHQDAFEAAMAASAAGAQGRFWDMHARLFADATALDRASLLEHAAALGLDQAAFRDALDGQLLRRAVDDQVMYGRRAGATGAPTLFVNGLLLPGVPSREAFGELIEKELAAARRWVAEEDLEPGQLYAALMATARPDGERAASGTPPAPTAELDRRRQYELPLAGSPSRGPDDAPVTIVLFTDYQCPFCARAEQTLDALLERHPADVRVVWKNLPLPLHDNAPLAAEAALAAAEQGRFEQVRSMLYASQADLGRPALARIAAAAGLDPTRFADALDDRRHRPAVEADMAVAASLGIRGTPVLFVNGWAVRGAVPLEYLDRLVASELQRAAAANAKRAALVP